MSEARELCFIVGARPNFMKVAPVLRASRKLDDRLPILLVDTGQHYDREMSGVFIDELGLPTPDVFLGVGSGSHAHQTARVLTGMEDVLLERRPDLVVVAGDVNSTLGASLAAAKLGVPVAHIESGLRSFDETMPEEINRRLTDHLSSILLVHSQSGLDNLEREGIPAGRVHLVGNTMIDSVLEYVDRACDREPWREFGLEPSGYGLVTLHRPAMVDNDGLLRSTVAALRRLAETVPILFPVHPRARARVLAEAPESGGARAGLLVCDPLPYLAFLGLEAKAAFVLTDSGGIQEETSALGVPCFTLRENTERPVTLELGTNTLLGVRPERIAEIPELLAATRPGAPIPFWDGSAGARTARILHEAVSSGRSVEGPSSPG